MMRIQKNDDVDLVTEIKKQLKENDGYCPCRVAHTQDNKCMCKAFRDKIAYAKITGSMETIECDCGLYFFKEVKV